MVPELLQPTSKLQAKTVSGIVPQFVVPQAGPGYMFANLQTLHEKILLQELREKTRALVRTVMASNEVSSAVNHEAGHDTEPV